MLPRVLSNATHNEMHAWCALFAWGGPAVSIYAWWAALFGMPHVHCVICRVICHASWIEVQRPLARGLVRLATIPH